MGMATADESIDAEETRRSSIEKQPIVVSDAEIDVAEDEPSAFERLPDEIIQQILQATDSNGFASLALLNTKWRSVAQQAHLYAHHLAGCPSYATSHSGPPQVAGEDDLPKLRRLFAREVKRNLFEAYLRPSQTIIKIISNSISSSSCPGGEGIQFSPSPKGHHLLAYNSSRIHVIDVRGTEVVVKREFKILRRPAATCINDEGTMLAVLLTEMEVDVYDLTQTPPKRTQSLILDHSPRAIALSPCGNVLAAAYEGGIEVSSLNPGALATERRAVKCDGVDALTFSFDGTQILGTTVHSSQPNTVILTAPYYDPASHMADEENISALWTTSILFPNTSRDCSHAVLIQNARHEEASWTFTYDRCFETFRAVRVDDLRNGTTYFTGPLPPSCDSQTRLLPCTLPAASYHGELVSAGFQGKEIWLYGIPEDLDAVPEATANTATENGPNAAGLFRRNSGPSSRSTARIQDSNESARVPQWQILCDKLRNTFVGGYKVGELEGVNLVKFVADFADSSMRERLIIAARGVVHNICVTDDEGIDFADGGRITIMDFDYGVRNGTVRECTIEVGTKEPEVLEEEHRDLATEVAIVRRRTVAQKRQSRGAALIRSTTSAARPSPPLPNQSTTGTEDDDDPLVPRRIGALPTRRAELAAAETEETETQSIEEQEALDAPYVHTSPRSGTTLRRAATAAANTRRLHPSAAAGHIVYRRADGRAEHPHESDADNWVPPPPPYQKEDPGDLPSFLRHAAILPLSPSVQPVQDQSPPQPPAKQPNRNSSATLHQQPRRTQTLGANRHSSPIPPVPPLPSLSSLPPIPPVPPLPQGVIGSPLPQIQYTPQTPLHPSGQSARSLHGDAPRPPSRNSRYLEGDNIYDVSPPDSPAMRPVGQHTSRDPSDGRTVSNSATPPEIPSVAPAPPPKDVPPQTVTGTRMSTEGRAPAPLNLQIPSQGTTTGMPPVSNVLPNGDGPMRPISVSRTWPMQPTGAIINPGPSGYPYSAPPVNSSQDSTQSFSHVPAAGQLPSLGTRPLSGSFPLPSMPIDSRTGSEHDWRRTSYQRPVSQQAHYSLPRQAQPPYQSSSSRNTIHEPQPRQPHDGSPMPPGEEMPLIISTPKGVSGAFDPPERRISGRHADAPILAPVPRHPRPNTQAAILRPGPERPDPGPAVLGSYPNLNVPPVPASVASPVSSFSFTRRVPSLSRRASRAERSAAKNVADAKKRGWSGRSTRGKSRRKKKEQRDMDAASSAAWTDVTTYSTGANGNASAYSRAPSRMGAFFGAAQGNGQGPQLGGREVRREREKRCVVM
ncbi:hypothetical protein N656DRAFT_123377 [Canariomyces notabilis]|uniref:F-box domain-containing protein n=1 Tax=Canariomyces notabilis TaxID=2074819 RepID=A0AAN6TCG4_9PEZI|nr:hypothetical protein N656DRAFT_123377 [Canariomyces arenarius]